MPTHIRNRNYFILAASIVCALLLVFSTVLVRSSSADQSSAAVFQAPETEFTETEQELRDLINQERLAHGGNQLYRSNVLNRAADLKLAHMDDNGYWAHIAPDGTEAWTFITNEGLTYVSSAENLARNYSTLGGVIQGWLDSPDHRTAMLSASYTDVGVSVANTSRGFTAVALFARPAFASGGSVSDSRGEVAASRSDIVLQTNFATADTTQTSNIFGGLAACLLIVSGIFLIRKHQSQHQLSPLAASVAINSASIIWWMSLLS